VGNLVLLGAPPLVRFVLLRSEVVCEVVVERCDPVIVVRLLLVVTVCDARFNVKLLSIFIIEGGRLGSDRLQLLLEPVLESTVVGLVVAA